MRRRELMLLLGGAAVLHTASGRAQEPERVYRLGVLSYLPRESANTVALFDELRRSGFVEGQNLRIEGRFAIRDEEVPGVTAMLVTAGVDAILTAGERTRAVQQATRTIPILTMADDLVLSGLVSSLAHPGGNTTGVSILATELDGKRQELLMQLVSRRAPFRGSRRSPGQRARAAARLARCGRGAGHRAVDSPGCDTRGDRPGNRYGASLGRPSS
jgi:putative ABC transport system substrate-binding protein